MLLAYYCSPLLLADPHQHVIPTQTTDACIIHDYDKKNFGQSYRVEGNLKQCMLISTFHRSHCFLIATIGPIQSNPHVENFSYQDSSVSPKIRVIHRRGAPISRKRGDMISLRSVATQPPIDYVIILKAGGA